MTLASRPTDSRGTSGPSLQKSLINVISIIRHGPIHNLPRRYQAAHALLQVQTELCAGMDCAAWYKFKRKAASHRQMPRCTDRQSRISRPESETFHDSRPVLFATFQKAHQRTDAHQSGTRRIDRLHRLESGLVLGISQLRPRALLQRAQPCDKVTVAEPERAVERHVHRDKAERGGRNGIILAHLFFSLVNRPRLAREPPKAPKAPYRNLTNVDAVLWKHMSTHGQSLSW